MINIHMCTMLFVLFLQRLKCLRLETTRFDPKIEGRKSTIRCCLSNIRLLLVTINATGASEIEKVSTRHLL